MTTLVEYENTVVGYIVCFIAILIFGIFGVAASFFVFPLCRSANHRCPKCYNLVISNVFLGMPSLQDQVISLNIGSCAIILTRKILLILFITCAAAVALTFVVRYKILTYSGYEQTISTLSWEDYRKHCGVLAFLSNPMAAVSKFHRDYRFLNIKWQGYIAKLMVNANNHEDDVKHSFVVFLKMQPDDFENAVSLALSFDKELYNKNKELIATTRIGDKIEFNATLIDMGTDIKLSHLHGLGVKILPNEHIEIPESLAYYGRYSTPANEAP